jgi:archaellum component FlaC
MSLIAGVPHDYEDSTCTAEIKALNLEVKRCMNEIEKLSKEFIDMKKEIRIAIKELNNNINK